MDRDLNVIGAAPFRPVSQRPLGVREDVPLSAAQLRALNILEAYDLDPVRQRVARSRSMPPHWIDEAILEFRRYLALRVVTDSAPAMLSKQVDEVWHTFLLFTRRYDHFCRSVFGYFVHHDPSLEFDPDVSTEWGEFESVYRCVFGEPGFLWKLWRPL